MKSLCLLLLISLTGAAWKKCEDVQFCKTIRYQTNDTWRFTVLYETLKFLPTSFVGSILDRSLNRTYHMTFTCLQDDTFRIFIDDPSNKRFSPIVALDGAPQEQSYIYGFASTKLLAIAFGDNYIAIHLDCFRIDVYKYGVLVVTINEKGRMVFNSKIDDVSLGVDVHFPIARRAYGIPLHAEGLSLRTTEIGGLEPYRLFNSDYFGYPVRTNEALYGSIPVLYGVSTIKTAGVFWMNSAQSFIDIHKTLTGVESLIMSESGAFDLFVFTGPTLEDCVRQYSRLTGVTPLPQYFALGYHQSRYSYMSQEDVLTVVAQFDENKFPVDVIYLDIDHTDGYMYFTWNSTSFQTPLEMQRTISDSGRKLVAVVDPHIKVQPGYYVYDQANLNNYFVKNPDGTDYQAKCWPGTSSWTDFFHPGAFEWYTELYSLSNWKNSTQDLYVWNDMNEPAVFEVEENTFPSNLRHFDNLLHRDVHNIYGYKQTEGTSKGLLKRDANRRPFILTRSHFAGSQKYAAIWTGDNNPTWEHFQISIPMLLTESLAGMTFCGCDIGGFTGDVEEELLQRWYQAGAWYPYFRGHSGADTKRREPYLYPKTIQRRFRKALQERYAHLPYWYTTFYEHENNRKPVMRSLSYQYPHDTNCLDIEDEWLVGDNILVAPVLAKEASKRKVYLPGNHLDIWYRNDDNVIYRGGNYFDVIVNMDTTPVFYKGGSIIFRQDKVGRSTEDTRDTNYTAHVYCGEGRYASGHLYMDDFESYNYRKGDHHYLSFTYDCNYKSFYGYKLSGDSNYKKKYLIETVVEHSSSAVSTKHKRNAKVRKETLTVNLTPSNLYFEAKPT